MRRFSYILTVPLAVILVVFAIDNRDTLQVSFWPLPWMGVVTLRHFVDPEGCRWADERAHQRIESAIEKVDVPDQIDAPDDVDGRGSAAKP